MEFNLEWAKERARQAASGERPIDPKEVAAGLEKAGRGQKATKRFDLDAVLRDARVKGGASKFESGE